MSTHTSASQTLASRKFNVFINLFVGQIDFRSIGNDEGKLDSFGARTLVLDERDPHAQKDQFADGTPLRGSLLLKLPV